MRSALPRLAWVVALCCGTAFAGKVDRDYQMGEDPFEGGSAGNPVGFFFNGDLLTADSAGTVGNGDLQDLFVEGSPVYANVSGRPQYSGGVGIQFDGTDDYLFGANLNDPATSAAAQGHNNGAPGPFNYDSISDRSMQLWAKPSMAGMGSTQTVVMDSNEHGVRIENDRWYLRYNDEDVDSGTAVDFDGWTHLQVASFPDAYGGAVLYVDGVATAGFGGDYSRGTLDDLHVGRAVDPATPEFFTGDMDNLTMTIYGSNRLLGGEDFGDFDFASDNEVIAAALQGTPMGDVNLDGMVSGDGSGPAASDDVTAFVEGWNTVNDVGGIVVPDMVSRMAGDLNFDGRTDLFDYAILNSASPVTAGHVATILFIPEPSGVPMLLGFALLGVMGRRRWMA